MSAVEAIRRVTFDEWLAHEARSTDVRSELVDGVIYAMTGGSLRHSRLTTMISGRLLDVVEAQGCRIYTSDAAVRIDDRFAYYPDVMVACGPIPHDRYEDAPCLVVEVLSPSTSSTDRREKLLSYTRLPSVQTCILADPDDIRLEVYRRQPSGDFLPEILGTGTDLVLPCPDVTVAVDRLYAYLS